MRHIWRILKFTGSLWRYYVAISIMTILLAAMNQVVPLLTKGAIDQITKNFSGGKANVSLVALFAFLIFLSDIGETYFSNIGGYWGDMLAIKIKKLMSNRYY